MKISAHRLRTILIPLALTAFFTIPVQGQFLNKLKKRAERAAEEAVIRKTENKVYEKTGEVMDTVLNAPKSKKNPKASRKKEGKDTDSNAGSQGGEPGQDKSAAGTPGGQPWSKYNFVPGDEILFQDDLIGEENGEFPSRWDLLDGNAENAEMGGENIINLKNKSIISPLMEDAEYLPEVFTIEFDAYFSGDRGANKWQYYGIRFHHSTSGWYYPESGSDQYYYPIMVYKHGANLEANIGGVSKTFETYEEELQTGGPVWRHIALAFNKRSLKVFVDQHRVLNIPNLGFQPNVFNISAWSYYDEDFVRAIRNIRVAEGGKKLYERVMSEGKFVTRGILFDVDQASLKPESMGVINEVARLMREHPELNFSIEGHTDSDGAEQYNQELSANRADAVRETLVGLGIEQSRMQTRGLGESVPVAGNDSPEGKANNRRVEFVKI